jgi:hypothetical protein
MASDFRPATVGIYSKRCRQCGTWLRPELSQHVGAWPCRVHPGTLEFPHGSETRHGPRYTCCGLYPRVRVPPASLQARDRRGCTRCDHDFVAARPGEPFEAGDSDDDDDENSEDEATPVTARMPTFWVLPTGDAALAARVATFAFNTNNVAAREMLNTAYAPGLDEVADDALWLAYGRASASTFSGGLDKLRDQAQALWTSLQQGASGSSSSSNLAFRPRPANPEAAAAAATADRAHAAQHVHSPEDALAYVKMRANVPVQLDVVRLVAASPDPMSLARIQAAMRLLK